MSQQEKRSLSDKIKYQKDQMKQSVPVLYLALRKKETPLAAKIMGLATVAYALSPIDLIPDFIPLLGYLDDFILLPLMIRGTLKLIPEPILEACRQELTQSEESNRPKKWYYSLPILVIWTLILWLIVKNLLGLFNDI